MGEVHCPSSILLAVAMAEITYQRLGDSLLDQL